MRIRASLVPQVANGTAFSVTLRPEPELDATHLAVGRVVEGMDVVRRLAALPRVPNNKNSPFFM
jgi:peptidyl-prolyl cis-trans isomerase B (cyclophilin B)